MVGFYCSSYGGFVPLRDFVGLLSLEGTKSRITYPIRTPTTNNVTRYRHRAHNNIEFIRDKVSYPSHLFS